jgi:inner membrane transporter RhtA
MSASRPLLPYAALFGSIVALCVGTSFAKTLFPLVGAQGTTTYRVVFAALILMLVWRPWRHPITRADLIKVALYGAVVGLMNLVFYMALRTVPLGLAIAIEFTGPLVVAVASSRKLSHFVWIGLAVLGLGLLLPIEPGATRLDPVGVGFACVAAVMWALYIILGKRMGHLHAGRSVALGMTVAALIVTPFGLASAGISLFQPKIIVLGLVVGDAVQRHPLFPGDDRPARHPQAQLRGDAERRAGRRGAGRVGDPARAADPDPVPGHRRDRGGVGRDDPDDASGDGGGGGFLTAARHEPAVAKALIGLAVGERGPVRLQERAAGRHQHRLAGRRVPLHGRTVARIDVGGALGDAAQLDRAIHRRAQVEAVFGGQFQRPLFPHRVADQGQRLALRPRAHPDRRFGPSPEIRFTVPVAVVNQTSPVAGAQTAPATGTPSSIRPILTVKFGSPRTKALVPSTGSTRKKRGPMASGVPNSLAYSSEMAGTPGNSSDRRRRIRRSPARSASVTGLASAFWATASSVFQ